MRLLAPLSLLFGAALAAPVARDFKGSGQIEFNYGESFVSVVAQYYIAQDKTTNLIRPFTASTKFEFKDGKITGEGLALRVDEKNRFSFGPLEEADDQFEVNKEPYINNTYLVKYKGSDVGFCITHNDVWLNAVPDGSECQQVKMAFR